MGDSWKVAEALRSAADDLVDAEFTVAQRKRERDRLIVEARREGIPLRQIAETALVSHQTVANVVAAAELRDSPDQLAEVAE
jgi:hypothetical protein